MVEFKVIFAVFIFTSVVFGYVLRSEQQRIEEVNLNQSCIKMIETLQDTISDNCVCGVIDRVDTTNSLRLNVSKVGLDG